MASSSIGVVGQGRRQWDHKALAEQWMATAQGEPLARRERLWLAAAAMAGGALALFAAFWLFRGGTEDRAAAVLAAPRMVVPPAPAHKQVGDDKLQQMRQQELAFLSKLSGALETAQKPATPRLLPAKAAKASAPGAAPSTVSKVAAEPVAAKLVAAERVPPAAAAAAPAAPATCKLRVSDLSSGGTLTYESVSRVRGAYKDPATGIVRLPPVEMDGHSVVLDVRPDGCVEIARSSVER